MVRTLRCFAAAAFVMVMALDLHAAAKVPDSPPTSVFAARRQKLMDMIGPGVAVLYARGEEDRDGFKSDADFYYLTGIDEEGAILVLAPGERKAKEFLFLRALDPESDRWMGVRGMIGDSLRTALGFDRIYRTSSLDRLAMGALQENPVLHSIAPAVSPSAPASEESELYGKLQARIPGVTSRNHQLAIAEMRQVKEPLEIERMEKAIANTIAAQRAAARAIRPGVEENWVTGLIDLEYKRGGSTRPAFPSIVGSGINSCILHYPEHDHTIAEGSLVVVDIGAEYEHYAADITRTYPASGRFSPEQRAIYDLVLKVQKACIQMVKPGAYYEDIHDAAVTMFRDAGYRDDFIHGLGHWVGLEVHDAGNYRLKLAPGMVLTIEPGLYLADRQLGVRIEDMVLVTRTGCRVLTEALPREADAIEAMMATGEE